MNISGVLVRSRVERVDAVREELSRLRGVEVHAQTSDGRLVVTVEEDDDRMLADTVLGLQNLPGVLSATMIYHHYE